MISIKITSDVRFALVLFIICCENVITICIAILYFDFYKIIGLMILLHGYIV